MLGDNQSIRCDKSSLCSRMGYQKKGYMSGEIGVAWLKDWNAQTKVKAGGRTRLLIVDGHSSHYTLDFLEYAQGNNIVVLCYPSHSTHVYQGLDVVIFSVLKQAWSDERDKFEARGLAVTKLNFMTVYVKAHVCTFTESNIRVAFAKTGIVPYNPDVVTEKMMAPSLETSTTSLLPLGLASPICELVDLISCHNARKRKQEEMETEAETPEMATGSPNTSYMPVQHAVASLVTTSSSFLVSSLPILPTSMLPPIFTICMSPIRQPDRMILDTEPSTEFEAKLQEAFHTSNMIAEAQKKVMQAQTVLHSMYLEGVQGQLQAQEEKKSKKRKTGKINMDGHAKILMQDNIIAGVQEWQDGQDKAVEEAVIKKRAREKYTVAMDIWKVREMDQKEQNAVLKGGWDKDVKKWTVEQDNAKYEHRKPRWTKPKMPTMEKTIWKSMLADFNTEEPGSDEDDDDDDKILVDGDSD